MLFWTLLVWAYLVQAAVLLGLLLSPGGWRGRGQADAQTEASWPPAAVVMPVTGEVPGLAEQIASLLAQDFPEYRLLVVVRDRKDPAWKAAEQVLRNNDRGALVEAGPAQACGQKNHNLLAGVAAAGDQPAVLTFIDAGHRVGPDWLREMARPVVQGGHEVATGYHLAQPEASSMTALAWAACVATLHALQGHDGLRQCWGGSLAITRTCFHRLDIASLWSRTVVDDLTLSAHMAKTGLRAGLATGALLTTPLEKVAPAQWSAWLFRQWFFLKVCFPAAWVGLGLLVLGMVTGAGAVLAWPLLAWAGLAPSGLAGPVAVGLALTLASCLTLGRRLDRPAGPARWTAACLGALAVGAWAWVRTCLSMRLTWAGRTYRVGWGGWVRGMEP